jgi:DNA-directed RNA polymerase specialized sigma24 family protein
VRAALLDARESFAELVTRHWKIAVVLAARVLGSADLAGDAAQEAVRTGFFGRRVMSGAENGQRRR